MKYFNLRSYCNKNKINLFLKDEVTSTMDEAKNTLCHSNHVSLFLAQTQNKGRGRILNIWDSKKGNIFFTLKFLPKKDINQFYQLGFIVSLQIKKTINFYNINNVFFKWPNDIYINDNKVGGILIESFFHNENNFCLLGIGINFESSPNISKYKTTYLKKYNKNMELDLFLTYLIENIINSYNKWNNYLTIDYINLYKKSLMYIGKNISVYNNQKKITYKFVDITKDGYLLVEKNNKKQVIFSGSMELVK